jgi:TetR/AcrR family transcriptional regulator
MPEVDTPGMTQNQDVRSRIVDAAERLFAEKGYDATSISDIAEAAVVGRALIYYYFKDKRDLYDSILRDAGERIMIAAQQALGFQGLALARLRHFVEAFLRIHVEHPYVPRMVMRAEMEGNMAPGAEPKQHFDRIAGYLSQIVAEGIGQGEFREVPPDKVVHFLMGITHSLIMQQIHGGVAPSSEDVDLALGFFARGVSAVPPTNGPSST